jgi:hypothetical protein
MNLTPKQRINIRREFKQVRFRPVGDLTIKKLAKKYKCDTCTIYRAIGNVNRNLRIPKRKFCFSCGCSGILPRKGGHNKLAGWPIYTQAYCRVAKILTQSRKSAERRGGVPINSDTSHSFIRELMSIKKCWLCGKPLKWGFGKTKTPHLHHDHETGEIYGFTHPACNPRALYNEVIRLRQQIERLKYAA